MHKFRNQKRTFSGTCSTIAAKIGLVVPGKYVVVRSESGKMARVLCDKLKEMKEKYSHFEKAQNCKLPLDINIAFS